MIWYEALGYSLLYAYVFIGGGYFIMKIWEKVKHNASKQETVKKE